MNIRNVKTYLPSRGKGKMIEQPSTYPLFPWKANKLLHFLHLCLLDVFPVSWMKFFWSRFSSIAQSPPPFQGGSFGLLVLGWGPVPCICMRLALLPGLSASFSRVQPPGAAPIFVICHWPYIMLSIKDYIHANWMFSLAHAYFSDQDLSHIFILNKCFSGFWIWNFLLSQFYIVRYKASLGLINWLMDSYKEK